MPDWYALLDHAAAGALFGAGTGAATAHWLWTRRRRAERLHQSVQTLCDTLGEFADTHRGEAAKGLACTGNRRALTHRLDLDLADPAIPWPRRHHRRSRELAARYAQTADDQPQAAAQAAEALRAHLARLLP